MYHPGIMMFLPDITNFIFSITRKSPERGYGIYVKPTLSNINVLSDLP